MATQVAMNEAARMIMPVALRILVPVDATERSRWSARYAMWRCRQAIAVEVELLFVAEPVTNWEVLRFRTQSEVARFQAERGQFLLEDAAQPLVQAGVAVRMNYREGDVAFQILDTAEQLDCHEIVLPAPHSRWTRLLSRDVVRQVMQKQRRIPVVTVNADGLPEHALQG